MTETSPPEMKPVRRLGVAQLGDWSAAQGGHLLQWFWLNTVASERWQYSCMQLDHRLGRPKNSAG